MLDKLLPAEIEHLPLDTLQEVARVETKSGNFGRAAAILLRGYEFGGPAAFLNEAHTYTHYLLISRRMLRQGVLALEWEHGNAITDNFSSLYDDDLIDQLSKKIEREIRLHRGSEREPSDALLLSAELRQADGASAKEIARFFSGSRVSSIKSELIIADAHFHGGDLLHAQKTLQDFLALSPRNPNALHLSGLVSARLGNKVAAADFYDRGLRSLFTPIPEVTIPVGELHYRSTILQTFDVYAYSDGYCVIRKHKKLVGVTMVGGQILHLMDTPSYRLLSSLKPTLEKFISISRLKAAIFPPAKPAKRRKRKTRRGFSKLRTRLYDIYDRLMSTAIVGPVRPHVRTAGLVVYRTTRPFRDVSKSTLSRLRPVLRKFRRPGPVVANLFWSFVLASWLKAKPVPMSQRAKDVEGVFSIVSQLIEEEEV